MDPSSIYLASAMSRHHVRSCDHILEEGEIVKLHKVSDEGTKKSVCKGLWVHFVCRVTCVSGKRLGDIGFSRWRREGCGIPGCRNLVSEVRQM